MPPDYVIGIDLGTTNSALAYTEIRQHGDPFVPANVQVMTIPQLSNPGEVREQDLLPSFLYLPGSSDFPAGSLSLPWNLEQKYVVGELAQKRGAENAGRLVSSAKSWLSYSGVDRTAPLVPFRAPEGVDKISPVWLNHERWEYRNERRTDGESQQEADQPEQCVFCHQLPDKPGAGRAQSDADGNFLSAESGAG